MRRPLLIGFVVYALAEGATSHAWTQAATTQSILSRQSPEQSPAPPSPSRKVKIWTNEDLITLRTPADIYILEKEAQAAAFEMQALLACFVWNEETVEETQNAIEEKFQVIRDSENAVAQARKQLDDAPENLKARNQKELERRTAELEASREQLKVLQERFRELAKPPIGENPATAPAPPPE